MKRTLEKLMGAARRRAGTALCALLALAAFAGPQAAQAETSVDYMLVLSGGKAYKDSVDDANVIDTSAMGLTYADGVWTMQDFRFTTTAGKALRFEDDATITVAGSNTVASGSAGITTGIELRSAGTFQGTGSLTVTAGDCLNNCSFGVALFSDTKTLVISGITLTARSGNAPAGDNGFVSGIKSFGAIAITNATVNAYSGSSDVGSYALDADMGMTVAGTSVVTAIAENQLSTDDSLYTAGVVVGPWGDGSAALTLCDSALLRAKASNAASPDRVFGVSLESKPDVVAKLTGTETVLTCETFKPTSWFNDMYTCKNGSDIALDVTLTAVPTAEPIVTEKITAPDHATAQVYADGALASETSAGSGVWNVLSNKAAYVVYTAEAGYFFADGTTVKMNALDTTVNPATEQGAAPAAPTKHEHGGIVYDKILNDATLAACWTDQAPDIEACFALPQGNYFVATNLCLAAPIYLGAGTNVNLCLNGKVISGMDSEVLGANAIFMNNGTLAIDDCGTDAHTFYESAAFKASSKLQWIWEHSAWNTNTRGAEHSVVGGCICDATGGGIINLNGARLTLKGGNLVGFKRAGVMFRGGATGEMSAGAILGCGYPGAYVIRNSTFEMSGTARIAYNATTSRGAGVYVDDESSFTMTGGSIDHNVSSFAGSGVCGLGNVALLGGDICSNKMAYVETEAALRIAYHYDGAGVYLQAGSDEIEPTTVVGGAIRIFDNYNTYKQRSDNLFLQDGRLVDVSEPDAAMRVGVDTGSSDEKPLAVSSLNGAAEYAAYFFADDPQYRTIDDATDPANKFVRLKDRIVEQPNSFNDFKFVIDTEGLDGTFTYAWSQMVPQPAPATTDDFEYWYCGSFNGTTMTSVSKYGYEEQTIHTFACFEGLAAGDAVTFKASVSDLVCGSDESGQLTYDSATDRWTYTFTYVDDWGDSEMYLKSPSATAPFTLTDVKVVKPVAQTIEGEAGAQLAPGKQVEGETYFATATFTPSDPAKQSAFTLTSEKAVKYHAHDGVAFVTPIATEAELRAFCAKSGTGYLTADVSLLGEEAVSVCAGATNRLCLNGHAITHDCATATNYVFTLDKNTLLAVYDCDDAPHYFTALEETHRWMPTNAVTDKVVKGGYIYGGLHSGILMYEPNYAEAQAGGVYSVLEWHGGTLVGCSGGGVRGGAYDNSSICARVLVTGGGFVGNTQYVYEYNESKGKYVLDYAGSAMDLHCAEFKMTGGEFRANYGMEGSCLELWYGTAEITGGVFAENEATYMGAAVNTYESALTLGGDALVTNNVTTMYGAIFVEGGALDMRDRARVVGNTGSVMCSGIICVPNYRSEGMPVVLSGDVQVAGNAGGDFGVVGQNNNLPTVDLNGLTAGARVAILAALADDNVTVVPETAAEPFLFATNVTAAAFAQLDPSRADQYLVLDDEGGLWIRARLVSEPTGANAFTYDLDDTFYTGTEEDGSVAYQWYPTELVSSVVTDESPDRPTSLMGYGTYATFDRASQTWSGVRDYRQDNIIFVGFNAEQGAEITCAVKIPEDCGFGGMVVYGADMSYRMFECVGTEGDMYLFKGKAPSSAGCFLLIDCNNGTTLVVSNLMVTAQSVDYAHPLEGQTAAAFDFSKAVDDSGSFACVASFIANDGVTTNFTMTSGIANFHLNRDEDGVVTGYFDTPVSSVSDLEALCASGGYGYLTADVTLPAGTAITVGANVKLCLDGHALVCGEGAGFSGDATLTFSECGKGTSGLDLGGSAWTGYRVEGPGTFTDEVSPSLLDTTAGYRPFDNGDSTWTSAKAWPVAFAQDGEGAVVVTNYVKRGEAIAKPSPDPTREGSAFGGWYTDPACTAAYDFATPVTGELALYAKWSTPGAAVENEDGELVPAADLEDAIGKAPGGGVVVSTNETPSAGLKIEKEVIITTDDATRFDGVAVGDGLAKTNSVGGTSEIVVVGQEVGDLVTVIRDRKADVVETPAAAGVAAEDWAVLTNLASDVQQTGIYDALTEETKTNFVVRAVEKVPSAEAVIVTVNLDVTPKDVKKEGGSYVKYTYDAQPVATIVAVKDGAMTTVAEGVELEAGSDFVKGAWFQVTLPSAGMMPVSVMHKLSDGSFDEYVKGDGACPQGGIAKTFAHNAVDQTVTFWTLENSEFHVLAVPASTVTLTYDAMGGVFAGGADAVTVTQLDIETYAFPADPTRAGYTFAGWFDGVTNGAPQVTAGTTLGAVTDLCAKWTAAASALPAGALTGGATADGLADTNVVPTAVLEASGLTDLPLPDRLDDGRAAVEIGRYAFTPAKYAGKVTSVSLGVFVTMVRPYAFHKTALTNVTFAVPHNYLTGAKATLELQDYAFANTKLTTLTFPAGGTYLLGNHTFYGVGTVEDVYFYGTLAPESWNLSPFRRIGRQLGVDPATGLQKKVKFHLNPSQAADAKFVAALTNGVDNACVQLDQEVLGSATTGSFAVGETEITVEFTPAAGSPWQTVNKDTVYLLYSGDVSEVVVGTGKVLKPTQEVVRNAGGSYTATFEKPAEATGFFRVCVGGN